MHAPPARYFPVDRKPLHMRPRLKPFPTDLGNGPADERTFQTDEEVGRYLAAKRPARYRLARDPEAAHAHETVLSHLEKVLAAERPGGFEAGQGDAATRYAAAAAVVQEDFTVQLLEPDGSDRAIALYVSIPSGWRPEQVLGWSFREIHLRVPDFADTAATAGSLVSAMALRGPYLRFVWSPSADGELDHHPEEGSRRDFRPDSRQGWLRIERQITVPFPLPELGSGWAASLFVIRTYLRPFASLSPAERDTLAAALRCMPVATARYKGLSDPGLERALEILGNSRDPGRDTRPEPTPG